MDEEYRPGVTPLMEVGKKSLRIGNQHIRGAIGEFFGTMIVGFMCVGAGVQATINSTETLLVPVFGIILGIMTAIIITGGVSGGHVNPAVSISLAVAGELSWYSLPGYLFSQFLGALVGALMAWGLLLPTIRFKLGLPSDLNIPQFDMKNDTIQIAGVFSPLKSPGCSVFNGLCTEMVLTCFLIMALCAVLDKQNGIKPPGYLVPVMIPLVIGGFCFTFELPSGTLLNPARDVGPRLAALILGWSADYVFMSRDYGGNLQHWWVVGLFGPILGGILGALIYCFVIGPQVNIDHLPAPPLPPMPFFMQPRDMIRQPIDNKSAAGGVPNAGNGGDWRNTFVPKGLPVPASNSNPFSTGTGTYANANNDASSFLSDAYQQRAQQEQQQQSAPFPGVYYPNHQYVKGW